MLPARQATPSRRHLVDDSPKINCDENSISKEIENNDELDFGAHVP